MKSTFHECLKGLGGIAYWVFLIYFVPHIAGCPSVVDLFLPAKIKGLYGVELGRARFNNYAEAEGWSGSSANPYRSADPYCHIWISKLKKSKRVYKVEATVRDKKLEEMLSLVKEKYGIKPKIKQFSDSKENYYCFEDFRSSREIHVWKEDGGSVCISAIDYGLKKLVEKEKRELELEAL